MSVTAQPALHLPSCWPDLVVRPLGENGQYVVKDPRTGDFFHLGEQEHFLLGRRAQPIPGHMFESSLGP